MQTAAPPYFHSHPDVLLPALLWADEDEFNQALKELKNWPDLWKSLTLNPAHLQSALSHPLFTEKERKRLWETWQEMDRLSPSEKVRDQISHWWHAWFQASESDRIRLWDSSEKIRYNSLIHLRSSWLSYHHQFPDQAKEVLSELVRLTDIKDRYWGRDFLDTDSGWNEDQLLDLITVALPKMDKQTAIQTWLYAMFYANYEVAGFLCQKAGFSADDLAQSPGVLLEEYNNEGSSVRAQTSGISRKTDEAASFGWISRLPWHHLLLHSLADGNDTMKIWEATLPLIPIKLVNDIAGNISKKYKLDQGQAPFSSLMNWASLVLKFHPCQPQWESMPLFRMAIEEKRLKEQAADWRSTQTMTSITPSMGTKKPSMRHT